MTRTSRILLLLALLTSELGAETRVLHDFDHAALDAHWRAQGPVQLERAPAPAFGGNATGTGAPGGRAVHVVTAGKAAMFTRGVTDITWSAVRSVAVWIHRDPGAAAGPSDTLEIQLHEPDRKTRFWRKQVIDHTGWKRFDLPLPWMRWSDGRIPRWEKVEKLVFWFRDDADLWIDAVSVETGTGPDAPGARLTLDDLAAVVFPGRPPAEILRFVTPEVQILAGANPAELEEVGRHLVEVARRVASDWGPLLRRDDPGRLVILGDEQEYRTAVVRLAEQLSSHVEEPRSDGFTMQGIALVSWDFGHGVIRPTFTHEMVHSLAESRLELPNLREWLHEGLASFYQLEYHPQENFGRIVGQGLERADLRLPLSRLTDGEPIPLKRYWQALTLLELLRESPVYAPRFPALLGAFREKGSTRLTPHLDLIGTDAARLEADWSAWCRERHAK